MKSRPIQMIFTSILCGLLVSGCSVNIGAKETASSDLAANIQETEVAPEPEKLPDFEANNLSCDVAWNTEYEYVTMTKEDETKTTIGKATFTNHKTFSSDTAHPAHEGYAWHTFDLSILFDDENAVENGFNVGLTFDDYYDCTLYDESSHWDEQNHNHFTVHAGDDDAEYSDCELYFDADYTDWTEEDTLTFSASFSVLLPVDYDGFVVGLYNKQIDWPDEKHIYEVVDQDSLFLRLNH